MEEMDGGRVLCGPCWSVGVKWALSAWAVMPKAPVRSWRVQGSHSVPMGGNWGTSAATLPWAGGAVVVQQPQRFLPSQHVGWKINGGEKTRWLYVPRLPAQHMVSFHPGATEAAGLDTSLGCWGLARALGGSDPSAGGPNSLAGSPSTHGRGAGDGVGQGTRVDAPPLREAGEGSGWGFAERETGVRPSLGKLPGLSTLARR